MSTPADALPAPIVVANAPVSYGAFEVTVGSAADVPDANVPAPKYILDQVAQADYDGIDLGPIGYLGQGDELVERLASRRLSLAGGFLELPFSVPGELAAAMAQLDALLDVLDMFADQNAPARPTLADAVRSVERRRWPGRSARDRSFGLDHDAWLRFAEGVRSAADRCRARGHEASFHHHTGSYVEAVWEIERLLELTDVSICLDTGHLLLGWGDPVAAVRDWGERINHVHLKDARSEVLERIMREGASLDAIWEREAFCALGQGDVDLAGVVAELRKRSYSGWIVVEQDIVLEPEEPPTRAAADQKANRTYLWQLGV